MTIRYPTIPQSGVDALHQAIERRQPSLALRGRAVTRDAELQAPAVPYYHLGLDALGGPDPLALAEHCGWRFSLDGDGGPTMAKLGNKTKDRALEFQGIAGGLLAERYRQALALAEQQLGPILEEYEARLLEVPALNYVALWLRGADDKFIPLLDGKPPGTERLDMIIDILPELGNRASRRHTQAVVRGASGTPTN